jgi:hypothetical protein
MADGFVSLNEAGQGRQSHFVKSRNSVIARGSFEQVTAIIDQCNEGAVVSLSEEQA